MKITINELENLIDNELSSERPWWHGPFESDWDKKNKELCDKGDAEACKKIEPRMKGPTDDEWNAVMKKMGLIEMKITNKQIKQIIKEELEKVLNEMDRDSYFFNKRRKQMDDLGGQVSFGSHSSTASPHPQRHKLYKMLKSGDLGSVKQAQELARAVDDPLEVPIANTSTVNLSYNALEKAAQEALVHFKNTLPSEEVLVDVYDFNKEVRKRLSPNVMDLQPLELEEVVYNWALDNGVAYEDYILII